MTSDICFSSRKVWFKNKRAKCRQIQKQNTGKTTETTAPAASTVKKTTNPVPTKLKVKSASAILNSGSTGSLLSETSNFIKAQNSFLIPSGSTKVKTELFVTKSCEYLNKASICKNLAVEQVRLSEFLHDVFGFFKLHALMSCRPITHFEISSTRFIRRNRRHH